MTCQSRVSGAGRGKLLQNLLGKAGENFHLFSPSSAGVVGSAAST